MNHQGRLSADTAMGGVTLLVADLDRMTAYYRDALALDVISTLPDQVTLGRGTSAVVILQHTPLLKHASPSDAGLFHTAVLYETQEALAAAVYQVSQRYPGTFTGSADHLVSEAFYFDDPEGNGVELYWDRERSSWSWVHGRVQMGTFALDPNAFLRGHLTEAAAVEPRVGAAVLGHVHLSVGDVASAKQFYVDQLGFEVTAELGDQALFVSAGGYHHHMAMNTWRSSGAGQRIPALGLGQVDILVPSRDDLGEAADRMRFAGIETRDDGRTLSFEDPWSNTIQMNSKGDA